MRQLIRTNNVSEAELNEAAAHANKLQHNLTQHRRPSSELPMIWNAPRSRPPLTDACVTKQLAWDNWLRRGTPLGVAFAIDFAEVRLPIGARESQFLELPEHVGDAAVDVVLQDAVNPDSELQWRKNCPHRGEGSMWIR